MSKPNLVVYTILTVYLTAMSMLVMYLIYARFSPVYQEIYYPLQIKNTQKSLHLKQINCHQNSDCVIDSCRACQAINKNYLTKPNICMMHCPFSASCVNQVCTKLPR